MSANDNTVIEQGTVMVLSDLENLFLVNEFDQGGLITADMIRDALEASGHVLGFIFADDAAWLLLMPVEDVEKGKAVKISLDLPEPAHPAFVGSA